MGMRWIGEEVWARLPEQADRATAKSAASEREDAINHGKSDGRGEEGRDADRVSKGCSNIDVEFGVIQQIPVNYAVINHPVI
jgi:hypothetical protein